MLNHHGRARGRRRLLALAAAATALTVTACGSGSSSSSSASGEWQQGPVTFVHAGAAAPAHIDPAQAVDLDSFTVTRNLYDTLVWTDSDLKTIPWLATDWTTTPDGLTTTFTLQDGVKFSDGSPLTSADVKVTMERIMALQAGPSYLFTGVTGVEAVDDLTVAIHTAQPDTYLLPHLTKVGIVSSAAVTAHKTDDDPWATKWFDENSAGSGPYVLGEWQKGVQLTMEKNKDWWKGWEAGSIDTVIDQFVTETSSRVQMVEQGTADFASSWPATDALRVGKEDGFSLVSVPTFEIEPMFSLNTQKAPFDNKLVRQAAQLAFDYGAVVDYYQGEATTPGGPIPSDYPGAKDFPAYEQDQAKAKELIAQSGVDLSKNPVTFVLPAGYDSFSVGATIFQESLQKVGFTVEIQQMPFSQVMSAYSDPATAGEASVIISSPYSTDPTVFLGNFYLPGATYNFSMYDNPQVTSLVEQARSSLDQAAAETALQEAETLIRDDAPAIWAGRPNTLVAVPDYVKGYEMATVDYRWTMYFWQLRIAAH
jgi:peptide/nickel transport system substrate-binding protein